MNELDALCRTYCLDKIEVERTLISNSWCNLTMLRCVKLVSTTGIEFVGYGKTKQEMELNCIELFETHQYLHRNGLLTTKNLN